MDNNLIDPFLTYPFLSYLEINYPNYDCSTRGVIYENGNPKHQFNSNGYKQVKLKDKNGISKVIGSHCIIAMKYLDYYEGCNVHHKDQNRSNNNLSNLEIKDPKEHAREHSKENTIFHTLNKGKPAWNKGMKMSKEFCKKCSKSAKERNKKYGFGGNQYIDKYGNKKEYEYKKYEITKETHNKMSNNAKNRKRTPTGQFI